MGRDMEIDIEARIHDAGIGLDARLDDRRVSPVRRAGPLEDGLDDGPAPGRRGVGDPAADAPQPRPVAEAVERQVGIEALARPAADRVDERLLLVGRPGRRVGDAVAGIPGPFDRAAIPHVLEPPRRQAPRHAGHAARELAP